MTKTDTAMQEMVDEFALRKLVHAYCRAVDRGDFAQLQSLYHHDAVDAHGAFSAGTADDFLDHLTAARPYIRSMQHNITTVNFAINGHEAEGEIYTIAIHTLAGNGRDVDLVVGGRYLDKYEKRDGAWKIVAAHHRHRLGPRHRPVFDGHEPPDHERHPAKEHPTRTIRRTGSSRYWAAHAQRRACGLYR